MKLEDFDNDEDKVIQDKLKRKTWNEIRTNDSWAIFKIMSEFVNGYETMSRIGPCVTIFGSARLKPDTPYYLLAEKLPIKLVKLVMASLLVVVLELWRQETRALI